MLWCAMLCYDMWCHAMMWDVMLWCAKICYDMLCHAFKNVMPSKMPWFQICHIFKNVMVSEMPCFQKCHGFKNAMFSRRPCYGKCWVWYDIVTSWSMFTNVKSHGKMRQVRCRTNLPWSWRIHVQVQDMMITFRDREGLSFNSQNC